MTCNSAFELTLIILKQNYSKVFNVIIYFPINFDLCAKFFDFAKSVINH